MIQNNPLKINLTKTTAPVAEVIKDTRLHPPYEFDENKKTMHRYIKLSFWSNEIDTFDQLVSQLDEKQLASAFLDFLSIHIGALVNNKDFYYLMGYEIIKGALSAISEDKTQLKQEIIQDLINTHYKNKLK